MRWTSATALLLTLPVTAAFAQSINVDLGYPGTEPPGDYRAAGMPGAWNKFEAVDPAIDYALAGLDGQLTAATVHQFGGTEIVADTLGGAGQPHGPDAVLLGDALVTHTAIENCLFFNGLENGTYEVTTYAWMPTLPETENQVRVDFNPELTLVGGAWTGAHEENVTYARHYVNVTTGFLGPHSGVPPGGDFGIGAALNGIQLRRLTPVPPLFSTDARLTWLVALDAVSYDMVRGDLGVLRSSGGDFAAATGGCVTNDFPGTRVPYPAEGPGPGEAHWYVVRSNSARAPATYDSEGTSQVGLRDLGIGASAFGCD